MTIKPRLDLARSLRTVYALRRARHTRPGLGASGHPSLTAREEALLRAATRRTLQTMTSLTGVAMAGLIPLSAVGMTLLFPERQAQILAINGILMLVAVAVTALVLGPGRRRPLPLAFVIVLSAFVTVLHLLVYVPESRTMSFMLLAMIPPAVALFLPWGRTVQVVWLLAGAAALAVFTISPAGAAVPTSDWAGAWLVLVISGLASLVGQAGAESARRARFARQVELSRSHVEGRAREAELGRLVGRLAQAARTDPLTGVGNRLRLNDELAAMTARSTRYGRICAVVLLDLDHFKEYNDSLGHMAGDAALQAVATALQATVRAADAVCRFGGEEFVVLLPEQSVEDAARAAERICDAVERLGLRYPTPAGPQALTISAGVALLGRGAARDADNVLRAADAALYRAKRSGRNRVATAPPGADRSVRDGPPRPPSHPTTGLASGLEAAARRH